MQNANHHAHTEYSDGRGKPEDYVASALKKGLKTYGFTDHAPIPLDNFGAMEMLVLPTYLEEVELLKKRYEDRIQLFKGLEVDYIPGVINVDSQHIQDAKLDYTVGAVHYVDYLQNGQPWGFEASEQGFVQGVNQVFGGNVEAAIRRYYELIREMVATHCPDIVAHLDRIKKLNQNNRFFSEQSDWYRSEVIDTLEVIADSDAIMEVNTKGYYNREIEEMYPSQWVLKIANELEIPVQLASDAHHPDNIVKGFEAGAAFLFEAGYQSWFVRDQEKWVEEPISELVLGILTST